MNHKHLRILVLLSMLTGMLAACGSDRNPVADPQDTLFTGVNFVGLSIREMQRSVAFYSKAANLTPLNVETIGNSPVLDKFARRANVEAQSILMKSANAQLLFMEFSTPSNTAMQTPNMAVSGPGIAHVCYQVNEKTNAYEHFLDAGATAIGNPEMVRLNKKSPVKYAYARDLDGAVVEVEHVDVAALDLPEPPKNDYRIRHVSLATPDMNRMIAFYSTLLDQPKPRRVGRFFKLSGEKLDGVSGLPGSKVEMVWFQIRNLELEIIQYHSHASERPVEARPIDAPGYNMIVLDVKDLDKARKRFVAAGGEIVSDIEPMFGGEVLFGRDPDGNLLGMQLVDPGNVMSSQNFLDNGT